MFPIRLHGFWLARSFLTNNFALHRKFAELKTAYCLGHESVDRFLQSKVDDCFSSARSWMKLLRSVLGKSLQSGCLSRNWRSVLNGLVLPFDDLRKAVEAT